MNKSYAVIFDLDDTLIRCNQYYVSARSIFIEKMITIFDGYKPEEVLDIINKNDMELLKSLRFNSLRFGLALAQSYQELAQTNKVMFDPAIAADSFKLAMSVFEITPEIIPETIETLESLDTEQIYLLTAGSTDIQYQKLIKTGLLKYFKEKNIFIFDQKTKLEANMVIRQIQEDHNISRNHIYLVGDNLKIDIRTALDSRITPVYIDAGTSWHASKADIPESFRKVKTVKEAIEWIKCMEEFKTAFPVF